MSYFISRGRQQYGQYSVEDIRYGLAEGKFLGSDLAWQKGMEEWRPLDELIEPTDAPLPARAPKVEVAPYAGKPVYEKKRDPGAGISGFAVIAMLMGVISLVVYGFFLKTDIAADLFHERDAFNPSMILGYVGAFVYIMIFGHRALTQIDRSNGKLRGKGMAVSGIFMGYFLFILLTPTTVAIATPAMNESSAPAMTLDVGARTRSENNAKTLVAACIQYASRNGGVFPVNLEKLVEEKYVGSRQSLRDPLSRGDGQTGYEYLAEGMKESDPDDAIVLRGQPQKNGARIIARKNGSVNFALPPIR
ncbi:MAG: hypothetical protein RL693_176 [Verrucomicrobiota bacterium]|jgi:hypothetical protein